MPAPIEERIVPAHALRPEDFVGRATPLVLRGLGSDWPAVRKGRESATAFAAHLALLDSGGVVDTLLMDPAEGGVVGYDADMAGFNYAHHRVSVTQGLKRLAAYSRQEGATPGLAIQSAPIDNVLPGLIPEDALPFLDGSIRPRIWIGNRVTTPAHFDEFHNIAVVACGRRRFTLLPPAQVRNLYVGPLDFAPTGAAIGIAPLDASDPRFPRLQQALEHALVAELEPGDAIFIPPVWWHHVESLEELNALVNWWWKPASAGGVVPGTALGALMNAILALRSLPATERKAWRELMDWYVFGDEDPTAHIPAHRKGVLGDLTPALAARLRDAIRHYL
jgi:cupin-like protein